MVSAHLTENMLLIGVKLESDYLSVATLDKRMEKIENNDFISVLDWKEKKKCH